MSFSECFTIIMTCIIQKKVKTDFKKLWASSVLFELYVDTTACIYPSVAMFYIAIVSKVQILTEAGNHNTEALVGEFLKGVHFLNPIALRAAKTLWSFGHSECNRVKPASKVLALML